MSRLKEIIAREQQKRDMQILRWRKEDKSISWIARKLEVSRQRIQQIVDRLNGKVAA
jgi:DNA-binding CsgD family transcriptional regulator